MSRIVDEKKRESGSGRKRYRRPELRLLGAVHLMTRGFGGMYADAGATMMFLMCERAMKENLARIGEHPLGIGLYLFDYKPEFRGKSGYGRQFGVMADEVETVLPEAVSVHRDGYRLVDYAMLGIWKPIDCKP
jgi:hypothetical protein